MELTEAQIAEIARRIPDVKLRENFLRFVGWFEDPEPEPVVASAPDSDVPRFCRDCRWMESEECQRVTMSSSPRCANPSLRDWDLVLGTWKFRTCATCRLDERERGGCGESAAHFSPREAA